MFNSHGVLRTSILIGATHKPCRGYPLHQHLVRFNTQGIPLLTLNQGTGYSTSCFEGSTALGDHSYTSGYPLTTMYQDPLDIRPGLMMLHKTKCDLDTKLYTTHKILQTLLGEMELKLPLAFLFQLLFL